MNATNVSPNPNKIYRKSNSFVGFRQDKTLRQETLRRVNTLRDRLEAEKGDGYKARIVLEACEQLVARKESSEEPRFELLEHVLAEIQRIDDFDLFDYLFYRYRYDMFPIQRKIDAFPPCLQIEPASICNYRCVFCYQTDGTLTRRESGQMGIMHLDLFRRIIDQAEGHIEAVTLASRGEPLINKQLDQMLAYASGKFLAFKINTNASLLNERLAHAILASGTSTLVFSADAASEPLYSQMRVNGKLDKVLANVRMFKEIRSRDYPKARIITRVSGVKFRPDQSLDEMQKIWGDLVDQVAFVDYNPWENTYERRVNEITTPCSDLWRRMFVWWDGTVNPCDVDYLSKLRVGEANRQSISEIWQGCSYSELREKHLDRRRGTLFPCQRCTVV